MTFLPIATRELRVASRRPNTFRIRWITALGGAAATFLYLFTHAGRPSGFGLLIWLAGAAFVCSAMSGLFLTSDCLSEERREGTLGLLYLTGLGGAEIVIGKLIITGLNALLALMSLLPILAFAWILGGVASGEFWRAALALLNTLWVSLTLALFTSAFHRGQRQALSSAFIGILIWILSLGGLYSALHTAGKSPMTEFLCSASPAVAFLLAPDTVHRINPSAFWQALALSHAGGWAFLMGAGICLWNVRLAPSGSGEAKAPLTMEWDGAARRVRLNRLNRPMSPALLDDNPLMALLVTRNSGAVWMWVLVVAVIAVILTNSLLGGKPIVPMGISSLIPTAIGPGFSTLLLTVLIGAIKTMYAWHACDFFATARRQQALEFLLTTPISDKAILQGILRAQRRKFMLPLTLLTISLSLGALVQMIVGMKLGGANFSALPYLGSWLYTLVTLPLDFGALLWMGILLSIREPRPEWAFAKTVGLVIVLPILFFFLPSALITGSLFGYAHGQLRKPIRTLLERKPPTAKKRPKVAVPMGRRTNYQRW